MSALSRPTSRSMLARAKLSLNPALTWPAYACKSKPYYTHDDSERARWSAEKRPGKATAETPVTALHPSVPLSGSGWCG